MTKQCPLCEWNKSESHWGRHMVKVHGWRYLDGIHPVPLEQFNKAEGIGKKQ